MDRETLIAAGIDYDAALQRFVGKVALYEKYLVQFTEDKNFEKLETAMQNGDCKGAFKAAHALKGVVGTLGINRMFTVVGELVESLRAEEFEKAQTQLPAVKEAYENTICIIMDNFGG